METVRGTLKFIGGLILIIALISTIVYGGWIMWNWIALLIGGQITWEITQTHLAGLMQAGESLAVILIGFIIGKKYMDEDLGYKGPTPAIEKAK